MRGKARDEVVEEEGLDEYRHLALVAGNDARLIDVALISKLPIGAVTSWPHRTYKNRAREAPIFSRDLLEVEVLSPRCDRVLFTLFNNHVKSRLATNERERRAGDARRMRQAETIAAILDERRRGRFVILGDMNDRRTSAPLHALHELGLVNAPEDPDETGGPYPPDDPDQPRTRAWTHRHRLTAFGTAYKADIAGLLVPFARQFASTGSAARALFGFAVRCSSRSPRDSYCATECQGGIPGGRR